MSSIPNQLRWGKCDQIALWGTNFESPLWRCSEEYLRSEGSKRLLFGSLCVASLPPAIIGKSMQISAQIFQAHPITYLQGTGGEEKITKQVTILNLNVCFLKGALARLFGGMPSWKKRIDNIVSKVLEKNPDIVFFEEVHAPDSAYALYEKLSPLYKHFFIDFNSFSLGFNSGLFMCSKVPIGFQKFHPFTQYSGNQRFMNKAFMHLTVLGDDQQAVAELFHTHLQPFGDPNSRQTRKQQNQVILAEMNQIDEKIPVALIGDLNVIEEEDEFAELFKDLEDPLEAKERHTCTEYFEKHLQSSNISPEKCQSARLDYSLWRNTDNIKLKAEIVSFYDTSKPEEALSDHNALLTTMSIKEGM